MKHLKTLSTAMVLVVTACGGGSSKGKKVSEYEFKQVAFERQQAYQQSVDVPTKAVVKTTYTESSSSTKETIEQILEHTSSGWQEIARKGSGEDVQRYLYYFDYQMKDYENLLEASIFLSRDETKYYVASKSATITGKSGNEGGGYLSSTLSVTWNEYGLLSSLKTVSKVNLIVASSTTTVTISVSYSNGN